MLRHVLTYLRPYRWPLVLAFVQVAVLSGLEVLKPWPLKILIDHVLPGHTVVWPVVGVLPPDRLLLLAALGTVGIYALLGVTSVVNNFTTISIGQGMVNDLRSRLYAHIQRLSLSFHARSSVGDLIYRVTSDTYSIQALAMNGLFPIIAALWLLVGMFVVMVRLDWQLTVVALAVCPLLLAAVVGMNRRITTIALEAREKESAVFQLVQRNLSAIKVVQAFSRERAEEERFRADSAASLRSSLRLYVLQTAFGAGTNTVIAVGTAIVFWAGAHHVWGGQLTVGDMVVFISYLASLYAPINSIVQTYGMTQGAKAGVRRVFEILEEQLALPEGRAAFPGPVRGDVALRGVRFGYDDERPILRGIDLEVRAGECLAIVGPTGAGKSTLVSLIPRFYDPQEGVVSVDGVDVRTLRSEELRRQVSMVLQPPIVFPLSVHENIAYGRGTASRAEVEEAARVARADEFIRRLPQGYDTVIGEQGATLSEGERQRLTIARALLRDAPILILDEPTSSVDVTTEKGIMEGIERLIEGRTTFVIAHRLSTVRRATRIVVLRDGAIAESGSFDELIRRRGIFHDMYAGQFERGGGGAA